MPFEMTMTKILFAKSDFGCQGVEGCLVVDLSGIDCHFIAKRGKIRSKIGSCERNVPEAKMK